MYVESDAWWLVKVVSSKKSLGNGHVQMDCGSVNDGATGKPWNLCESQEDWKTTDSVHQHMGESSCVGMFTGNKRMTQVIRSAEDWRLYRCVQPLYMFSRPAIREYRDKGYLRADFIRMLGRVQSVLASFSASFLDFWWKIHFAHLLPKTSHLNRIFIAIDSWLLGAVVQRRYSRGG